MSVRGVAERLESGLKPAELQAALQREQRVPPPPELSPEPQARLPRVQRCQPTQVLKSRERTEALQADAQPQEPQAQRSERSEQPPGASQRLVPLLREQEPEARRAPPPDASVQLLPRRLLLLFRREFSLPQPLRHRRRP